MPGGAPGPVKHLCFCHPFRGRPALPTPLCHPPRQSRLPLSTRPTWFQGPLQSGLAEEGEPSHFSRELLREPAPLPLAGGDRANILSYILLLFLSGMSGCLYSCLAVVCVGPCVSLCAHWLIAIPCCSRKWRAKKRPFVAQVRNEKEWLFPTAYRKKKKKPFSFGGLVLHVES